ETGELSVDHTYARYVGIRGTDHTWSTGEFNDLMHPEDKELVAKAVRRVLDEPEHPFQATYRVKHSDGRWVWLEAFGSITARDAAGRALRMSGTHMNVTERKLMERALSNTLR